MSLRLVLVPAVFGAIAAVASCTPSVFLADATGGGSTGPGSGAGSTTTGLPGSSSGSLLTDGGFGGAPVDDGGWRPPASDGGGWGGSPIDDGGGWGGVPPSDGGGPPPSDGGWGGSPPSDGGGWGGSPPYDGGGWGGSPPSDGGWPPPGDGGIVGSGFHLLGARWTGSHEIMDLIDPITGHGTTIGQLGDLAGYSSPMVLGHDGTRAYAIGNPSWTSADLLITLDLTTGISSEVATAQKQGYFLAGVTDAEKVIGIYWDGAAEQVDLIDPTTGLGTNVGHLGDLTAWADYATYDHVAHVLYAWGSGAANQEFLYSLNIDSHQDAAVPVGFENGNDPPLGGVTAQGALVCMSWTGTKEVLQKVDPAQASFTTLGNIPGAGGFAQNTAITYDAASNVAYIVGLPGPLFVRYDLNSNTSTATPISYQYALVRY